ncbi:hypothetical protein [Rhizomonospora bruguierae]|uniref:hypothetical protein n=1 Tax=Rhizomonospora bruguierae TaxID=1581705 RepID=UPI001BCFBD39|nr:hypothetical protein [Micromonospora sp. NBRC 107566]
MADLTRAVDRLVRRVGHWEPPRWSGPVPARDGGSASRADLMHALVQRIADHAADAEGIDRRPVPRLDNDRVLPDQFRVVSADLAAANPAPPLLSEAVAAITETAHHL